MMSVACSNVIRMHFRMFFRAFYAFYWALFIHKIQEEMCEMWDERVHNSLTGLQNVHINLTIIFSVLLHERDQIFFCQ